MYLCLYKVLINFTDKKSRTFVVAGVCHVGPEGGQPRLRVRCKHLLQVHLVVVFVVFEVVVFFIYILNFLD